jgi:CheY-like chemotaxis protein
MPTAFSASTTTTIGGAVQILLVEGNPGDATLFQLALQQSSIRCQIHVAASGDQALAFLTRQAPYTEVPRPDLIVLELNVPGVSGREVLLRVKTDSALRMIPVVVLSNWVELALGAGTDHLLVAHSVAKPVDWDEYERAVAGLMQFWVRTAAPPAEVPGTAGAHG